MVFEFICDMVDRRCWPEDRRSSDVRSDTAVMRCEDSSSSSTKSADDTWAGEDMGVCERCPCCNAKGP
jgi:hypothetical protein